MEYKANDLINEMEIHKNTIKHLKTQTDNMKNIFNDSYKKLKNDLSDEVINLENQFDNKLSQQKIRSSEINKELTELKNDLLSMRNFLCELKDKAKDLQILVDGDFNNK